MEMQEEERIGKRMGKKRAAVVYGDMETKDMAWYLDGTGVLYLRGEGRVPAHAHMIPWEDQKNQIRCVRVDEGVTELGINAFAGCENLVMVVLPDSIERIHYGCFYNCRQLVEVQTAKDATFRFAMEPASKEDVNSIVFGIKSFYGTPWACKKWGDFYIKNGTLHACFTTESMVTIPEEVHTIGPFAYQHSDVVSVEFHDKLTNIDRFAFGDTGITQVRFKKGLKHIAPYAFAGSPLSAAYFSPYGEAEVSIDAFEDTNIAYHPHKRGKYPDGYQLILASAGKEITEFKQMKIRKKVTCLEEDAEGETTERKDTKEGVVFSDSLNIGRCFLRRMKRKAIILAVRYDEEKKQVLDVKSYSLPVDEDIPLEYTIHPCYEDEENMTVGIGTDTIAFIQANHLESMFFMDSVSEKLERDTDLRAPEGSIREDWFWSGQYERIGGSLEMLLLKQWMNAHPEYRVDTKGESQIGG